jgi:hypothetical protein
MTKHSADRAVVLGGSLAGLVTARVLADAYGHVMLIDRDELPEETADRRGVPQGRHVHGLLARGQQALEELFPGLTAELIAGGVPAVDMLADSRLYIGGHRLHPAHSGLVVLCVSRPYLEGRIRAKVRARPNITFVERSDILGLATTSDHRTVTGARVLRRADGSAEEVLDADLVIDATGRGSRTPIWLDTLGYAPPQKQQARIGLGYATRIYRLRPGALGEDRAVLNAPPRTPPGRHTPDSGRRPLDPDAGRHPGRLPAHRPRWLPCLRPVAAVPRHPSGDSACPAARRPGRLPLPGQRPAPLRQTPQPAATGSADCKQRPGLSKGILRLPPPRAVAMCRAAICSASAAA